MIMIESIILYYKSDTLMISPQGYPASYTNVVRIISVVYGQCWFIAGREESNSHDIRLARNGTSINYSYSNRRVIIQNMKLLFHSSEDLFTSC